MEKCGKTMYFFAGGGYKQTMPLTWEDLAQRIEQYLNSYYNPAITMHLPKKRP